MPQENDTTNPTELIKLPPLLAAHLRWMLVLAKLKELEVSSSSLSKKEKDKKEKEKDKDKSQSISVQELAAQLELASLFSDEQKPEVRMGKRDWDIWVCGKGSDTDSGKRKQAYSPLNSIYQCRNFYALDAPNNLVQRLTNMFVAGMNDEDFDKDTGRTKPGGKYDQNIKNWGKYALNLVERNGGWEKFASQENLSAVEDFWPGKNPPPEPQTADIWDSFIRRVLALEKDRYIQILTSTVAVLWPLWFLKEREHIQLLKRIAAYEDKDFRVGKALPEEPLFIDINTVVGKMSGLPYPFGFADYLLENHFKSISIEGEDKISPELVGTPWPSKVVFTIAKELKKEYWSPPLLFGARGEEFPPPDDAKENYPIPLISISAGSSIFANLYRHKKAPKKPVEKLIFGFERGTYGERIIKSLQEKELVLDEVQNLELSRTDMARDFQGVDVDIVLSYFPVDILIQTNEDFQRLSKFEIYQYWKENGDFLIYDAPSIVLAGGMFLSRQPKMNPLMIDLAIYLQKIEFIIRLLRPEWESIDEYFLQLQSHSVVTKKRAANAIAKSCRDVANKSRIVKDEVISADAIPEFMKAIAASMTQALIEDEKLQETFNQEFQDWGWARLFEFCKYTSIFISCDLFGGVK